MDSSDDDGYSEWLKQMFSAVSMKQRKGKAEISEQARCEKIKECLGQGINIDEVDELGDTVLHKAVMKGYFVVIKFLREKKASIEIINEEGLTAISLAEKLGETEISKYLDKSRKEQIEQSCPRSSSAPVDNQRPSTSATLDTGYQRRPHDTDNNDDVSAKKLRTSSNETSEDEISTDILNDIEQSYPQGGITKSLHGNIYQLKHYMLILQRASKLGYKTFRLAKEMEAADKLDDLVFEYKDKDTASLKHRFIQFKHNAAGTKQITYNCLLNETDGDFSLLKYFGSWIKINQRPEFYESVSKDYIICTNIGLDDKDLKDNGIIVAPVTETDEFLKVTSSLKEKKPQCYKLKLDADHDVFDILKTASDIHRLAQELAEHVHKAKKLTLTPEILKKYHVSLNEILDIGKNSNQNTAKFKENFVDPVKYGNLNDRPRKFHDIFLLHVKKLPKNKNKTDDDIWRELKNFEFHLSETFGKGRLEKLPDDCISHNGISRFFKELTIAADQPNEDKLTEIMKKETEDKFNLLNTDSFVNDFQAAVLNWFKESGPRGRYLKKKDVDKIWDEIWENSCTQVTMGLSKSYKEKLKNYDFTFKRKNDKLWKFLSSKSSFSQTLKLTSRQETLLIALSIYQTLETKYESKLDQSQMEKYQKADSYILMKLEELEVPDVLEIVLSAFGSPRSHHLLIIDCAANGDKLRTLNMWNKLEKITSKKDSSKKLILIDQSPNDSSTSDKVYVDIGFKDSDEKSRAKLLEKMVRFQGKHEMSWGTLLGSSDLNNVGEEDEEDLARIFDADTLVKLIQSEPNKPMEIGKKVKGLDHLHYIDRTIIRHGILKKRIPTEQGLTDLIATNELSLHTLKTIPTLFSRTGWAGLRNEKCIMLQRGREADDFKNRCREHPTRKIHWLEYNEGALICKQSTGGISNLVTYDYNTTSAKHGDHTPIAVWLKEDELLEQDGRVILVSDTAGMGKSTLLTRLAQRMKTKEPSLLIIQIDLSSPESTSVLLEEKKLQSLNGINIDKAVDFLVDKLVVEPGSRSHIFKRLIMKVKGRAALLFDGFDEISPVYEETVSTLLCALAKLEIKNLVVSTRLHTIEALERKLKTRCYMLRPFSDLNQEEFLITFWKRQLTLTNVDNLLQDHAKKVIQSFANSINDRLRPFTGVPLQTQMVAEVYSPVKRKKQTETADCDGLLDFRVDFPDIPDRINLIKLYRELVDKKKYVYYIDKNHGVKAHPGQQSEQNTSNPLFDAAHQNLDALFDEHIVSLLLNSQQVVKIYSDLWQQGHNNGERTGIVTRVIGGKPEFVHRTYAEYFAAEFLFNTLEAAIDPVPGLWMFFLADLFIARGHETIRAFLNCIFLDENIVPRRKEGRKWNFRKPGAKVKTTALHKAAAEGNFGIVKFLLFHHTKVETSMPLDSKLKSDIDTVDIWRRTPLHEAASKNNCEIAKYFIDEGANIHTQDNKGSTPLHEAALYDDCEIAKYLVDRGANIHAQDIFRRTPLHSAAFRGNSKVAKYLTDKGANIHTQDIHGETPLHEAASRGNFEITKCFINNGADIHTEDKEGRTPLNSAAFGGNWEIAKYLFDKGANIHTQDKQGSTPLHKATRCNLKITKYLIDKGANIRTRDVKGRTPLHKAALNDDCDIAKYLIDKGADDIRTQDKEGRTPLHEAASRGNLEIAKYLIDKGANIHIKDKKGRTPLHEAASRGNLEITEYFIDKGADSHTEDEEGRTPLNSAAFGHQWKVAKYLIDKGSNIHTQDKQGSTPLHEATGHNSEMAKYLIDNGANIHTQDNKGRTPLHKAALNPDCEIAKYLIDKGANIHTQDNKGSTPLHEAASSDDCEMAKYLIDKGANIHAQDEDGKTPLHHAAFRVAKYLIDKGANIHTKDKLGRTPLYKA